MVLGLSAWAATFGLVVVFFVIFPVLAQGLIAFALAQAFGEKADNDEYARHPRPPGTEGPPPMPRPVAVVTGAARGIGLETARRLSATHRVALLDLDAEGVERAAAGLGDPTWPPRDITQPASRA